MIQTRVIEAYADEQVKATEAGYVCTYDDYDEDRYATLADGMPAIAGRIEPAAETPAGPHVPQESPAAEAIEGDPPEFGAGVL